MHVFQMDDLVMLIGGDVSGRVLEIGVAATVGIEFIVHASAWFSNPTLAMLASMLAQVWSDLPWSYS